MKSTIVTKKTPSDLAVQYIWLTGLSILHQIALKKADGAVISIHFLQIYFGKRKISWSEKGMLLEVWKQIFPYAKPTKNNQRNSTITVGMNSSQSPVQFISMDEPEQPISIANRLGATFITKRLLQQSSEGTVPR